MSGLGLRRGGRHAGPRAAGEPPAESPSTTTFVPPSQSALIGELLLRHAHVTATALEQGLSAQRVSGGRLGAALVELGLISDQQLAQVLAEQLDLPMVDLGDLVPDDPALALLPAAVAREHLAVPLSLDGDVLRIAVAEPAAGQSTVLQKLSGRPVALVVASRGDVLHALNRSYRALDDISTQVEAFASTGGARPAVQVIDDGQSDSPIVTIVDRILTQALRDRASDVHIEPQDNVLRVRFRIDGALHDALELPGDMGPGLVSRLKILAGMNIVERRRPQDGQISTRIDGRDIDIRVATTATIWGEICVLRLLDKNRSLLRLGDLGMPADKHEEFTRLARSPFGMVLCAGPTGSGKTTTLYATLAELNEPHRNIMTVEDPVEYVLPSINQIQMNEAAGISFATGLKSILRQDPDVILVGEIRDVETARIAVQSALTGHFVLSSLHATDAVAALHRFLDMGIESFLIASSVMGVVGQRLVRRICTHCTQPHRPTDDELAFYEGSGAPPKSSFYAGAGCNFCSGTGYLDRIGVYELLRITPEIKRLIVGWATQEELRRLAVSQGMRTLQDEALELIGQDVTTISEVMRAIYAF